MIFDKARVVFQSGSGGKGSPAVYRLSSGGSVGAGGDGGRGGSIILKVNRHLYDLKTFKGNKKFIAVCGEAGSKRNKKGKDADDLIVGVPPGTRVIETEKIVADLVKENDQILLCRGGSGGLGSYRRDYTRQSKPGELRKVVLDYRIPNEVAILGFANSGKTTLFNALCVQNQKVADYPFTTVSCIWAPCEYGFKRFTVLDTPPLTRIEKPSQEEKNVFLRQILRSKVVLFLSDNPLDYEGDFKAIAAEVERCDPSLLKGKKFFYLLAKVDTIDNKVSLNQPLVIGTKEHLKLEELKKAIIRILN